MLRIACVVVAMMIAGAARPDTAVAQSPAPVSAAAKAKMAAISQKRAGCKRQATAQKLDLPERRAFMRRCLRS